MNAIKVSLKDAERTKNILKEKKLFDSSRSFEKTKSSIIFPIKSFSEVKKIFPKAEFVKKELKKTRESRKLKDVVGKKLTEKELRELRRAYDIVGTIAIMEIPEGLEKKEKILAESLLKINNRIKTVVRKIGGHSGEFRIQKMKHLAGEKTKETVHRENGIMLKLNVETVYFSARSSSERRRISDMVKKGEKVLVMFSGCAPFVCVIAKNSPAREVIGIEANPEGHKYGLENIKLNKLGNARLYLGDVKKVIPELNEKFDRIIMPLPKSAEEFLGEALMASKKGTVIHFYDFVKEEEIPAASVAKIEKACRKKGLKCKILSYAKSGQQSPRVFRICVDFEVQ